MQRPNILLIVIDSARADRFSCYGYDRATTPAIDAIASEGARFDAAYSESSWTVPVMFSLLTGLAPREHRGEQLRALPAEVPLLSELLRAQGYTTFAASANPFFGPKCGTDRGFDRFFRPPRAMRLTKPVFKYVAQRLGWSDNGGRAITHQFLASLPELTAPWFAILWYFDVHSPYAPREPLTSRFARRRLSLWQRNSLLSRLRRPPELVATGSEQDLDDLNDLFDAATAYQDMLIGQVCEGLRSRGLWEEVLAFVTADHGEMLGERGLAGHGRSADLYQPVVRVPLVVHAPSGLQPGTVSRALVQLTDITETVARAAGITEALPQSAAARLDLLTVGEGRGRESAIAEREPLGERSAQAFQRRNPSFDVRPHLCEMAAVVQDGWKLIHREPGRRELYDLGSDPGEERDRYDAAPGRARRLTEALLGWYERALPHPAVAGLSAADEAIVEKRLQDLGYC